MQRTDERTKTSFLVIHLTGNERYVNNPLQNSLPFHADSQADFTKQEVCCTSHPVARQTADYVCSLKCCFLQHSLGAEHAFCCGAALERNG